jgi:hypothetical protein
MVGTSLTCGNQLHHLTKRGLTANIEIKELNIMLGLYGGEDLDVIFNTVIFISKWEIWKIRNKVKYNQSRIGDQTIFNTLGKIILKNIYNAHYKLRILKKMIKTN